MSDNAPELWRPRDVVKVPASVTTAPEIAGLAKQLSKRELRQVVQTFESGSYEIGTTFVWSRTMAGLKAQLGTLGMDFLAELLDRPDIRPSAEVHEVLTDFDAVRLAEELGMFGSSHAMRLRHSLELIAHFSHPPADFDAEGMMPEEAISVLRTAVQTVLGHETLTVAVEFAEFRAKLEQEVLPDDAVEIDGLSSSAYFFQRTVLRVLMAGVKSSGSAKLENLLANTNTILPRIWPGLMDPDRYFIGRSYAEVHADGQKKAASGLRAALLKVSGFDYVPEDLRSNTFIEAAGRLLQAHFAMNNFYNEPAPARALASLGSSIPIQAFAQCMTATLCVRLGNRYGISWNAQGPVTQLLETVTADRWKFFFDSCLPVDDVLLAKLLEDEIVDRWIQVIEETDRIADVRPATPAAEALLDASRAGSNQGVQGQARRMLRQVGRG